MSYFACVIDAFLQGGRRLAAGLHTCAPTLPSTPYGWPSVNASLAPTSSWPPRRPTLALSRPARTWWSSNTSAGSTTSAGTNSQGCLPWRFEDLYVRLRAQLSHHINAPEREAAAEMLERVGLEAFKVIADKGFSGRRFETSMADRGAVFLRPDRKDEAPQFGSLGGVRQRIESVFWTSKGQFGLECHGARTMPGLFARIGMRLLALSAGLWHNWHSTSRAGNSPPTPTEFGINRLWASKELA